MSSSESSLQEVEIVASTSESIPLEGIKNVERKNTQALLSSLMPCWMDPGSELSTVQSSNFLSDKGEGILVKLLEVIEDKAQKIYHYTSFRIICQYLYDVQSVENNSTSTPALSVSSVVERHFESVLRLTNLEYRVKILQILIVFWKRKNLIYSKFKENVRTFELSEDVSGFFALAFLLKEEKAVKFQANFETYLKNARTNHGDYYQVALKPHVRLLSKMADEMHKTREFIYDKFPSIEINSSIMKNFDDVQDFNVFINSAEPLSAERKPLVSPNIDLKKLTKIVKECDDSDKNKLKATKRELFSRNLNGDDYETVFERILSTPGAHDLIQLIWKKFDLASQSEILNLRNPNGKLLMSYVIDSKDDENLIAFLMPQNYAIDSNDEENLIAFPKPQISETQDDVKFSKKPSNLKMLNKQYLSLTGITLFERHIFICTNDLKRAEDEKGALCNKFFMIIFSLLEELGSIKDIKNEVPIDKLLELARSEKFYSNFIDGFEVVDGSDLHVELKKKRYYIDDLLAHIVAYWKQTDPNYDEYKKKLEDLSPFFKMIFKVIEHRDQDFITSFWEDLEILEDSYGERYGMKEEAELLTSSYLFVLLLSATLNHRKGVINRILNYESFAGATIKFPPNMRTNSTCQYLAKKLLEHGHEIGRKSIPQKWLTSKIFEEFLDSRIKYESEDLVEIDCSFLLHNVTKQYQVNEAKDADDRLVFWEDTEALNFIHEKESLKHLITHPVISTYINLKALKFQSIYLWNFLAYILFFVIPFGSLIVLHFLTNRDNGLLKFLYTAFKCICPFSVMYLIIHEGLQYYFVDASFRDYFRKTSNWLEASLVVTSGLMVIVYVFESIDFFENYLLTAFSVLTILLSTMTFLTMLPSASMLIHMIMLKKVGKTFIRFFATFICIVLAFTLSFCVIFGVNADRHESGSMTDQEDGLKPSNETSNEDFKNFENFSTSFLKVILMLSGEYQLEPYTLYHVNKLITFYQMIFFLFFVLLTFVLFNLILGLTIDDVQKLRENALRLTLKNNVDRIIETAKISLSIYEKFDLQDKNAFDGLGQLEKYLVTIFKKCITKYTYLHKIDKIYVNIRTREFTFYIKGKHEKVLTETIGTKCGSHYMKREAFDYTKNIIKQ